MKVIDAAALVMDHPIVGTFVSKDKDKTIEANFETFKQIWFEIVHYAGDKGVKSLLKTAR